MRIKQICLIGILLLFALLGFQQETFAEQLNKSVKDCIEQPNSCGQQQKDVKQESKKNASKEVKAKEDQKPVQHSSTVGLTIWDFIKMLLATAFVVALLYFILKMVNKKGNLIDNTQLVKNLGGAVLGTNRSIQVVKVGGRLLVVGVGENIQLLKEIDDKTEYDQIIMDYNSKLDQQSQPMDIVSKVMKRVKDSGVFKGTGHGGNQTFQTLLKGQLQEQLKTRKNLYNEIEKEKDSEKK